MNLEIGPDWLDNVAEIIVDNPTALNIYNRLIIAISHNEPQAVSRLITSLLECNLGKQINTKLLEGAVIFLMDIYNYKPMRLGDVIDKGDLGYTWILVDDEKDSYELGWLEYIHNLGEIYDPDKMVTMLKLIK